jgi:uncharacterized protein (DUF58 family)
MHLAQRAYLLLVLTAVLAIGGLWSQDPALAPLWRWPAALLLLGIALESLSIRRMQWHVAVDTAPRAFLGRPQAAAFAFSNEGARDLLIEYAPVAPVGFEALGGTRTVRASASGRTLDAVTLVPIGLGAHSWPALPARVLGRFELMWWSRVQPVACRILTAPDTARFARSRARGMPAGARARRRAGAGSELHQLRAYVAGDPLGRIDWKATARAGALISRELSEDQHLDILIAIDAGRGSRIRAGRLDRLGLYANIAARFAEAVTPNDDRIGLLVFSDRVLALCAPERGIRGVIRLRRALEQLVPQSAESDPVAAAIRMRALLKHRSLIVLFSELEDATVADPLARAVRLLSPPHLVVAAGVRSAELLELADTEAYSWRDPWVALAAREREARAARHRALLQRLGAPVVAEREERLQAAVLAQYELLRRARRI